MARYVIKKWRGRDAPEFYEICDPNTGEIHLQQKEFCLMSRRPGIGRGWFERFTSDTDKDFITLNGKKMSLPQYYTNLLEKQEEHEAFLKRKDERRKKAQELKKDQTYSRLRAKEQVKLAQIQFLKRDFED